MNDFQLSIAFAKNIIADVPPMYEHVVWKCVTIRYMWLNSSQK
jgi:hypothetical protein